MGTVDGPYQAVAIDAVPGEDAIDDLLLKPLPAFRRAGWRLDLHAPQPFH